MFRAAAKPKDCKNILLAEKTLFKQMYLQLKAAGDCESLKAPKPEAKPK